MSNGDNNAHQRYAWRHHRFYLATVNGIFDQTIPSLSIDTYFYLCNQQQISVHCAYLRNGAASHYIKATVAGSRAAHTFKEYAHHNHIIFKIKLTRFACATPRTGTHGSSLTVAYGASDACRGMRRRVACFATGIPKQFAIVIPTTPRSALHFTIGGMRVQIVLQHFRPELL